MPSTKSPRLHGERHTASKLSNAQVSEIRERRHAGEMVKVLAIDYGCTEGNISHICTGRSRNHG